MYNKKVLNKATANLDKAKAPAKKKDIIVDPMGQWKHPGQNTRIPGGNITMQGVSYPVLAQPNVGQPQMMYPGMDYEFPGADYVDEFPQGTDKDYIEADLTDEEIEEYRKGGYIVEDISVPELTKAQLGKTVGRYFVNPYEYNYDTRALRTKEDLDPAFGIGVTRENLFSGPRVKENEISTTGTISSRIPYNNPKPSVRGQLDISYEPKPKGALIPSTNTMMGVGYDPTVGFNSDFTVNQRFGFANVDASRFKKDDWKKGSATWGIGPAIETSFQTKAPDTLHGQQVDPTFTATSTKGAQYAAGLYGDVAFQPFKYPMHIGANAKLMADPFSAKSANAARNTSDENLNWTINPGLKVYASFPIRTNKVRPNQPEITKTTPIKSKYTPKYLQEGGSSDNYFTVPGSDGVYRKVNGFGSNNPRFILDIHNPYKMGGYLPEAQFGMVLPQMFRNPRRYNRFMRNLPFGMSQYMPGISNINVRKSGMFGRPKQYSIDFNNVPLQQMMASVTGIPFYINKSQRTPVQNKQVTSTEASKINNEALQEVATATQSTAPVANSTVQNSETKPVVKTEPIVKQAPVAVESKPVIENKQVIESKPAEVIKKIETPVAKEIVPEVVKEPEYGSQEEEFCYPGGTCFTLSPDQYDDQGLFNDLPRMLSIYSDKNNKGWTVDNENGFPQELDLSKVTKEDVLNTINSTSKNSLPIDDLSEYANLDEFADKFLKYHQNNQKIYGTKRYLDLYDDPYAQVEGAEPYQKYADWLNVMGTPGEDGPNDIWTTQGVLKKLPKQQKGGKLGPIHLNEGRKTLRDWVYGADIGMLQEQTGGYTDAELTDEEIQAYRDAGYHVEELD